METTKTRPLWWLGAWLRICVVAAVFTVVYRVMDNITVHNFIKSSDGLTSALTYLVVGAWTGVVVGVFMAKFFGRWVDADYKGVVFSHLEFHRHALIAGVFAALSTLFILWANQLSDPGGIIALANTGIVYVAAFELLRGKVKSSIILPVVLVILGGGMAAFNSVFVITLTSFVMVVVASNGLGAVSEVADQNGAKAVDGVNLFLWRFFWLAATGTVVALVLSWARGTETLFLHTLIGGLPYVPWIALLMVAVFFGQGLRIVAKKYTSVTDVMIATSALAIVFGFLATWAGNWVIPGVFGTVPTDPYVWIVRLLGGALLILGIVLIAKSSPAQKKG